MLVIHNIHIEPWLLHSPLSFFFKCSVHQSLFHRFHKIKCILFTVWQVGNTLVIAAVITTRRLRSVTNCFVSSLAAADLLVGLAVMPPAVLLQVYKSI